MKYVDVSQWQGVIDWETAKPHIDGAILRAGYGKGHIDAQFRRNAAECYRLQIPCGAYWFSYATTPAEARAEAEYLLEAVKPYNMKLPLAFDFEYDSVQSAKMYGVTVTKELATSMVYAFCETIEAGGHWCLIYANPDFLSRYFAQDVPQRFGLWLAEWPGSVPDVSKKPRPDVQIWQWGGSKIPGITPGKDVDTNESYVDFAKLNHTENQPATVKKENVGIFIKGIEMPKDEELLCISIRPDGKVCIGLDLECKQIATAISVTWDDKPK